LVSISGPPFGAVFPLRKSLARPCVGTCKTTRNDAALCTVNVTDEDLSAGIVSSKNTFPSARAVAGTASATIEATITSRSTSVSLALGERSDLGKPSNRVHVESFLHEIGELLEDSLQRSRRLPSEQRGDELGMLERTMDGDPEH
jgi:hypothetical protein